jgi:integrator complex subunit 11
MSFSAHADSKGIMELLTHLEPKNVMLVHGEKQNMKILAE